MATRQQRLSEFNDGTPSSDAPMQVLCEDHNGTYLLPYQCRWQGDAWHNAVSHEAIDAKVVGWREIPPSRDRATHGR